MKSLQYLEVCLSKDNIKEVLKTTHRMGNEEYLLPCKSKTSQLHRKMRIRLTSSFQYIYEEA